MLHNAFTTPYPLEKKSNLSERAAIKMNNFQNDGSFMEQFKILQQSQAVEKEKDQQKQTTPKVNNTSNKPSSKFGFKLQALKESKPPSTTVPAVGIFEKIDETTVSPPEDTYILEAIEEAAKLIFSGECTEDELRSIKKSNVKFKKFLLSSFLYNADCDEYKCFQEKLKELKKQSEANVRRKRKSSRWDTPTETSAPENLSLPGDSSMGEDHVLPGVSSSKIEASSLCKQLFTDQGMNSYALQVFGTTNLSPEQWKQLEEQRKIRVLFEMVQAKKTAQSQIGKEKYEYDSDEDVEGGTWEHKRRAREMEKTKALQEGRAPDLSDYKEFKLDESNVGYQMLMKLGWSEGQGLGVNESGIKDPVNKGNVAANNVGLGLEKPDEVASGDDEFQAYRKRMMLAYRFRPNPLVSNHNFIFLRKYLNIALLMTIYYFTEQSKKAILLVMVIIYIM
ncbi:SURP and G-patch domain-containing protein 1 [Nymphon striatum]|nr:SURP and G-patch domain-containing protein 1 [Nymphon striatum]